MRRKIPSTSALLAFESAARHESFTKAANELALTQGAICRQIGSLEDLLGVVLFRRTRRGVVLTESGRTYARQICSQLDALERDTLALMAQKGSGHAIELAVVPTFATRWLIPRLPNFYQQNPDIQLNLTTQTRPFLFEQTEFDAALYHGMAGWPGTEAHFLMQEEVIPVCSPQLMGRHKSLGPEQIAALPLLQQSTRPYIWRDWFSTLGIKVPNDLVGMRFELFTMLAKAAESSLGIALIPKIFIEDELASGRLVIAMNHPLAGNTAYFLILPEEKSTDPALQRLRAWISHEVNLATGNNQI